jgi:hypothetical protein
MILLIPTLTYALPKCESGNATSLKYKGIAQAMNASWMKNCTYCDFGKYQIFVPNDKNNSDIIILQDGKLFMVNQKGFGINLFQEYANSKSHPFITVQDWDKDGKYERLDYLIIDKNGDQAGNVQDKEMTGNTKKVIYKNNNK